MRPGVSTSHPAGAASRLARELPRRTSSPAGAFGSRGRRQLRAVGELRMAFRGRSSTPSLMSDLAARREAGGARARAPSPSGTSVDERRAAVSSRPRRRGDRGTAGVRASARGRSVDVEHLGFGQGTGERGRVGHSISRFSPTIPLHSTLTPRHVPTTDDEPRTHSPVQTSAPFFAHGPFGPSASAITASLLLLAADERQRGGDQQ